ncbi:MAG: histidine phosphatase family protein [Bacillota bacterium]
MKEKNGKTRLYLIRHGETTWNKERRYQGTTNIPLAPEGHAQANQLGKRFLNLPLDHIYCSPLDRAVDTAKKIQETKNVPLTPMDAFTEINFGKWEGHTIQELIELYGESYIAYEKNPFAHEVPGEGSFHNAQARAMAGVKELLQKHKNQSVAIVSHGGLLRVLLVGLLNFDETMYRKTWLSNTSITIVDIHEDGETFLFTLNDAAHLEGEAVSST